MTQIGDLLGLTKAQKREIHRHAHLPQFCMSIIENNDMGYMSKDDSKKSAATHAKKEGDK